MEYFMLYVYIPVLVIIVLVMILGFMMYSNKQVINELKDDSLENEVVIKNMIQAINYNDKHLRENQKYVYNVYEENNSFNEIPDTEDDTITIENNNNKNSQYFNMMKNYDALTSLS